MIQFLNSIIGNSKKIISVVVNVIINKIDVKIMITKNHFNELIVEIWDFNIQNN